MASPASTETIEIRRRGRRRLVGVVAIVVLLVVFLPMILDKEPHRAASEPSMQIPPQENAPPLPTPAPAHPDSSAPSGAPTSSSTPTSSMTAAATAKSGSPTATVTPATPAHAPSPQASAANTPPLEGYAVQVGAFRDEQTLRQARAKLSAAQVPHYVEHIAGGLTRLRAGPFPTRAAAEKAKATLQQASLDGQVVGLP